jgi:hypothetical protein
VLFLNADNPNIIAYAKMTEDRSDIIVCVVNLDPFHKHHSILHVPLGTFGIGEDEQYQAHDLLSGERYRWRGPTAYVELARAPRWHTSSRSGAGRKQRRGQPDRQGVAPDFGRVIVHKRDRSATLQGQGPAPAAVA